MKTTVLIYFAGAATVKVFGIFNPDYFSYNAAIYGLSGAIAYTLVVLLRRAIALSKEDGNAKPFNKYEIILLFIRPVASTVLSFLLAAGFNFFLDKNGIFGGESGAFISGMICGLFVEYIVNEKLQDAIWNKKIKTKILSDE